MVGVASGFYSSIFIASPVLTEWKEREPAYRNRRERIKEAMGFVPTFPEDNVVARIDEVERHVAAPEPAPALAGDGGGQAVEAEPAEPVPTATVTEQAAEPSTAPAGDGAGDGDGRGELVETGSGGRETPAERASRQARERRRKQRRRRRHGRNR
jgi:SecD/SecF fusion protein